MTFKKRCQKRLVKKSKFVEKKTTPSSNFPLFALRKSEQLENPGLELSKSDLTWATYASIWNIDLQVDYHNLATLVTLNLTVETSC